VKENRTLIVILAILAVGLLYLLYYVTGGNWNAWLNTSSESGPINPLGLVANSLRSLGRAIGDLFTGFLR